VDQNEEAFKLLNPVLTKLDSKKSKALEQKFTEINMMDNNETDMNPDHHPDSGNDFEDSDSSSDDEHEWTQQVNSFVLFVFSWLASLQGGLVG
jgi:hypothetical protein